MRIEIFTLAFRKVQDRTFDSVPSSTPITQGLIDREGNPLANGLYYVIVTANAGRSIGKLLVLR